MSIIRILSWYYWDELVLDNNNCLFITSKLNILMTSRLKNGTQVSVVNNFLAITLWYDLFKLFLTEYSN